MWGGARTWGDPWSEAGLPVGGHRGEQRVLPGGALHAQPRAPWHGPSIVHLLET